MLKSFVITARYERIPEETEQGIFVARTGGLSHPNRDFIRRNRERLESDWPANSIYRYSALTLHPFDDIPDADHGGPGIHSPGACRCRLPSGRKLNPMDAVE
jgi:hypothetical protein